MIAGNETLFQRLEWIFGAAFLIEYAARLWACGEDPRYGSSLSGRLRYMRSPAALVDLVALSASLLPFTGHQPFLLRLVRLLRIVRIARLGRFSAAMQSVLEALAERRYELLVSVMIAGMLILIAATLLYFVEGGVQPQAFGSIPRAMWWSVVTLTTVGYGDAAPVTPVGRVLAALTCVGGIGLIAMPTGILAAAFSDAMRRKAEGEAAALRKIAPARRARARATTGAPAEPIPTTSRQHGRQRRPFRRRTGSPASDLGGFLPLRIGPVAEKVAAVSAHQQIDDQPGPARLVGGAQALAGVGVEILVEQAQVLPVVVAPGTAAGRGRRGWWRWRHGGRDR